MIKLWNWTFAAVYQLSHLKKLPVVLSKTHRTEDDSGGQRPNPPPPLTQTLCIRITYPADEKTLFKWRRKLNLEECFLLLLFAFFSFSELLFPSGMKWQNCPALVWCTERVHCGCIQRPTHVSSSLDITRLRDRSCTESWTGQKIISCCWSVQLGAAPSCVALSAHAFTSGVGAVVLHQFPPQARAVEAMLLSSRASSRAHSLEGRLLATWMGREGAETSSHSCKGRVENAEGNLRTLSGGKQTGRKLGINIAAGIIFYKEAELCQRHSQLYPWLSDGNNLWGHILWLWIKRGNMIITGFTLNVAMCLSFIKKYNKCLCFFFFPASHTAALPQISCHAGQVTLTSKCLI